MIITGLAMTVPLILAAIGGNPQIILGFLIPAAFSLALGAGLSLSYRDAPRSITMKDGMFLTVLSWVLISCFGAMPYLLTGVTHSPISALFESISSYTTTGATILTNVSGLPRSILFCVVFTMCIVLPFIYFTLAIKWWIITIIWGFSLAFATPDPLVDKNWDKDFITLPIVTTKNIVTKIIRKIESIRKKKP